MNLLDMMLPGFKGVPVDDNFNYYSSYTTLSTPPYYGVSFPRLETRVFFFFLRGLDTHLSQANKYRNGSDL